MEKMKALYEKVAGDSGLQAKFGEIMGDLENSGNEKTQEKLIAFAKEAGFDVSFEEIREFFQSLIAQNGKELSDAELEMAAGGKGGFHFNPFGRNPLSNFINSATDFGNTPIINFFR